MAVLVDSRIYDWISWDLSWYTSNYVQNILANTRALVIPLDLTNIHAYDIYRMMENIYFDGLKDVNSQLIWLIMFWDIPLPVVNQNWYIFPTVYPYVDFENQKYVWDPKTEYFVSNNNPLWQAEIWHWLINYWTDIWAYSAFFSKIKEYVADPDAFIWDSFWYDDFIAQKEWFKNEDFPSYRNRIMFAEDLWYQRHSPLMKKIFRWEENENAIDIVSQLEEISWHEFEWRELAEEMVDRWVDGMHTTKMVQQELWTSFSSDYWEIFSQMSVSTMRENIFAWWRWIKEYTDKKWEKSMIVDSDWSSAKMQIKDDILLWNDDLQWLIENLNDLMEDMIDRKISNENLSMDIVVPLSYKEVTKKWVDYRCFSFVDRYENYYFWDNARLIDEAENLSIYRWTYRNLTDIDWVTYDTLLEWKNPAKSEYDDTNLKLKSIWWSYDIFSSQAEWNRWYTMLNVEKDLDIYDEEKTVKNAFTHRSLTNRVKRRMWPKFCIEDTDDEDYQCENLFDFARRWWWWASSINLVSESVSNWKYELNDYLATDSWRPIFGMDWFQSLRPWDDEWITWTWWYHWTWVWPQWAATSFKAYIKYSSPTQREWWRYWLNWIPFGVWYEVYENHTPDVHIPFAKIDYWQLKPGIITSWKFKKDKDSSKIFYIEKNSASSLACYGKNRQYWYKVISSVVKHKSTTEDQINWIDRDKYWENWTLGKYYHDVRTSYEDVQDDMKEILEAFPWLVSEVNSGDTYIRIKMWDLEAEIEKMAPINEELSGLNSQLSGLQEQLEAAKDVDIKEIEKSIEDVEKQMKDLDDQKLEYQEQLSGLQSQLEDATWTEYQNIKKAIKEIEDKIKDIDEDYDDLQEDLDELNEKLEEAEWQDVEQIKESIRQVEENIVQVKQKKKQNEENIAAILETISSYIKDENSQLEDIFKLVKWLTVENIISVLEFIIYLEWWNPDDYYEWWNSGKLVKIWFLPSWLSKIEEIKDEIKEDSDKIVDYYDEAYSLIEKQQEDWWKLAEKLKEASEENAEKIDKVTWEMNQIFTIDIDPKKYVDQLKDDEEDFLDHGDEDVEDVWWSVTLEKWTARESMDELKNDFKKVDKIFWNFIEEDTVWPAIVSAAKSDPDFLKWMMKHSVSFKDFSDADWINQYAQWAKWPWYDAPWAIKNHDLLIWVSEHMSWMNIVTADRPIDSPRYVVMQSVAGNEMKFIYPDLFKVEVYKVVWTNKDGYEKHELLDVPEIKENLIKYLEWKVEEYNTIMEKECANALSMNIYFARLRSLWYPLATPDTALHSCSKPFTYDEFVEALWWEKMLGVIAETLHYQSLTNKKKLSSWNVKKDLELIRKSFSLNEKREQIMEDYLMQWNEKKKNAIFEIPTYEVLWYEVAYINSDWKDYIFPKDDTSHEYSQSVVDATSKSYDVERTQSTPQEEELEDECGVPSNWKLPIFRMDWSSPWVEWFKCWLKKTLEKPIEVKLTFDNSLWEILSSDSLESNVDIREPSSSTNTFNDWWEVKNRYADKWESQVEKWDNYDADKAITELQVKADKHNQEVVWWDNAVSNLLLNVYKNVKISNTVVMLSDNNPTSDLRIESAVDVWNLTVEFIWTWEWCLKIDSQTVCNWNSIKNTFNPNTNPFFGVVSSADNVAWKVGLIIRVGVSWGYIENVIKYTVSPGLLNHIDIDGKNIVVAWMISPVTVTWFDWNWNEVSWGLERYTFTTTLWRFLKDWAYQNNFTTNDFRDSTFYYQAPLDAADWSKAVIQIKSSNGKIMWTYSPTILQANPVIKMDWKVVLQWKNGLQASASFGLSSNESIYDWWKLIVWKLHKFDIDLVDANWKLVDVDSQILVTSQNWLIVVWQVNKQTNWDDVFFETSKSYMKWGHVTVYYYPSTVAGDDTINIDFPWLETRVINLKVSAAKTANVQLDIESEYVKLDESMDFEIYTSDVWWNPTDVTLELQSDPNYVELPLPEIYRDEEIVISLAEVKNWYLKTEISWVWAWITDIEELTIWADVEFKVDNRLLPENKLNIMYLNYFGNDWWNQWWYLSENDKYIEKLMKNSNKIITTTTLLAAENKIKKLLWKVGPWFKIENVENVDTLMTIKNWKLNMLVWWLSEMQIPVPSLTWVQVTSESINTLLSNESSSKKNYAFFIPSESEYSIKDGVLYSSNERLANILGWELTLQLSSEVLPNWDNIWNVIDRWINYGSLIIHCPDFVPDVSKFNDSWKRYIVSPVFSKWSTDNMSSIWVFDSISEFELETNYKSIQNSDDVDEKVWFLWKFKNITLFAEWEFVWEATKKYWSELLINLWDPLLIRKDLNPKVYGTDYDWWIWQELFNDSEKDVFKALQIDFNRDWLKDWLYVYLDWAFKIAKNYGWKPDFRNMQNLMHVAVHVQDVYVWDADGNWYEDILVLTDNNQIRAYLNKGWIFDVDWSLACLNQNVFGWQISVTPSSLEWVNQFFVEDMDLDGAADIITYDEKWYIKVFFWWSTKGWPNYLSTLKYACDSWWYDREAPNTTIVTALWVQVWSHSVFDNSMMHWVWMEKPTIEITEDELEEYWIKFDPNDLEKLTKKRERHSDSSIESVTREVMDKDKFDVEIASEKFKNEEGKFMDVTLYENTLVWWGNGKNYVFAPSSFLDPGNPEDICSVWKNYSVKKWWSLLMDRDIVTVRVTVKASDVYPCVGAFWDIIQWPWNVYYDENQIIEWVRPLWNRRNAVLKQRDWNFTYLVDNITLSPWETMAFEYDLEYHHIPVKEISITHQTFYWEWPDIKVQSVDGCDKDFEVYHGPWRSFPYEFIPLQDMIDNEYAEEDELTEDLAEDMISYWSNANKLEWIVWDSIDRVKLLRWNGSVQVSNDEEGKSTLKNTLLQSISEWWRSLNMNFDVNLSTLEEQTDAMEDIIDDITKWMCNWFSFWWSSNCKWLPVPFNQAFLAPGKYHLFGCRELPMWDLEKWIPMFFFPWTLDPYEIPIPNWKKWTSDKFIWIGGWVYNSFVRIYAAPTLTAQLWIAVCLWDYSAWYALKSPWSDIWWNCVIFTVKPKCKNWQEHNEKKKDRNNPNAVYENFVDEVRNSWVCKQSTKWMMSPNTPFWLYTFSSSYDGDPYYKDPIRSARDWFEENVDVSGWPQNQAKYSMNFMWLINLERTAYVWQDDDTKGKNQIFIWDVDVAWWDYEVNKIRWWIQQWIRKILIDKWLDPQIRYIVNHITKMHVDIKLPDMSNLIDYEIETMKNVSLNFWDIWKDEDEQMRPAPMTKWSDISYDNLKKLNKAISNPFEWLANLMNESNIINISVETINVKVPIVFAEDINSYELYLQQRLDTNQKIVDKWQLVLSSGNFESKFWWWQKMQSQIYSNLMILQEYRNFPFEMYEWIHVIDRYMSEIASLINNTIWYLSYWTSTNAQRFVGYVDAIVLMLNIIRTYQVLIDFSIEWWQNCGNCTRDTYDQYTCKLSLLCDGLSLPIFQIPNFKLPNITIDLTNIDLGLDIILPDFNFQPVRINLPDIPNIPEPPSIASDIKIEFPDIPLLPEPPELPELPSFLPQVELELPILPPAPELPKFPSEIEIILKAAKLIWKIFCIVKWNVWLVWESSVKAKIEQLTQRTYEVKWIDQIMDFTNLSIAPIHHYWLDYEISAYVDLQFDFSAFYDYLDALTKSINNLTTSSVNWMRREVNSTLEANPLIWVSNAIDWAAIDIDVDMKLGMANPSSMDFDWLVSDDIEYVDYDSAKSRLEEVLAYFRQETKDTTMRDSVNSSINSIENNINKTNSVVSNVKGIENLQSDVLNYLDKQKTDYDELADLINNDYDSFLAMVDSQDNIDNVKSASKTWELLTFNVQLFSVDSSTKDTIDNILKTNPYETILSNKKNIIDWYWNAINSNTASDLWMSQIQYLVLRDNISSLRNQVTTLYSVTRPVSSTELIAKNSRIGKNKTLLADGWSRLWSNMEVADVIDPSVLSDWIYDKIIYWADKWKYTKIVYSDTFASAVGDQYYHTENSIWDDILLWDEDGVYLKCTSQDCSAWGGWDNKYYHSKVVKEIPYVETWLTFDDNTILKIADNNEEVKDRKVSWQTYDVLYFSRKLSNVDAYLIKLVERVDNSYEKSDYTSISTPVHYVLALPDWLANFDELSSNGTKLELLKKIDALKNLYWKDLLEVVYYDSNKKFADIAVANVDRKWYYARVATLNLNWNTYNITSPWSNQVVAWKQILWDQQSPDWNPVLYRPSVKEIVSQWDNLEWYVSTKYQLIVNWKDNVALYYISLLKDWKVLDDKYTSKVEDSVSTNLPLHTKEETETFTSIWVDQFGNKTEKMITVNYSIPEITITDISKNADWETVSIVAELSQDLDQWNVSFQRRRWSTWKTMERRWLESPDIPIWPKQIKVVWSPYTVWNDIAMYDKKWGVIALMNPDTAEIKVQTWYKDKYEVDVKVQDSAVLQVCDKNTKNSIFSISIPTEKCLKVEANNYNIVELPEKWKMWMYNGWKAIYKDWSNVLFISPTCHLYSEIGLEWTYDYDREMEAVVLTLYQLSDFSKKNPIKVWFKVKPFLES